MSAQTIRFDTKNFFDQRDFRESEHVKRFRKSMFRVVAPTVESLDIINSIFGENVPEILTLPAKSNFVEWKIDGSLIRLNIEQAEIIKRAFILFSKGHDYLDENLIRPEGNSRLVDRFQKKAKPVYHRVFHRPIKRGHIQLNPALFLDHSYTT